MNREAELTLQEICDNGLCDDPIFREMVKKYLVLKKYKKGTLRVFKKDEKNIEVVAQAIIGV